MSDSLRLSLRGLHQLNLNTQSEIIVEMRKSLDPIFKAAGKRLIITTGTHRGDLNIDFDSTTDTTVGKNACGAGLNIYGEDGSEVVFVRAHAALRVCGPIDPKSRTRDTRKVLSTSWLIGPAMANTAIHELGHFIADLDHVSDPSNFMGTGSLPAGKRTLRTQRDFWAGKMEFTTEQKRLLVEHIREEKWVDDMSVTSGTISP